VRIFFDTSVLVAALIDDHPHYARAFPAIRPILNGEAAGLMAAHSLCETYSVLTRLPTAPRIAPDSAKRMIEDNLLPHFEPIALTSAETTTMIFAAAAEQVAGGAVYDAIQAACAMKGKADAIYTFNVRQFRLVAPDLAHCIAAP